jgi:cyclopropane-fatty-acyl-phospholipid synthase
MFSDTTLLKKMQQMLTHIGQVLNIPLQIVLWDGSAISLSTAQATPTLSLKIADKGVVASLLKRPNLENLMRHYAVGNLSFNHDDIFDTVQTLRQNIQKKQIKQLNKMQILRALWPFLWVKSKHGSLQHSYDGDEKGAQGNQRNNQDYIQFHYDVSNDFYQLFLDDEMQYSCGYFTHWDNSLAQAQHDKLDMICKKLRLKSGEKFLDIGCGWGGLICHAAQHYGVHAHGITLSQNQYDFAKAKIERLGLQDKITLEIRDYATLDGVYDKISSIGMFEHIGLDHFPSYFKKVNSLLRDRGIFLNHGIACRAKSNAKTRKRITPEKQLLLKYIFPGSELAPIGFSLNAMESYGFEIHEVEAWREHYAHTCKYWYQNLTANKEQAIKQVGRERYYLWVAYLAGVSFGFNAGSMLIFQTLASKRGKIKGPSGLPPTRADLYINP